MDFLISLAAFIGILIALGIRIAEKDREEKKFQRLLSRTNKSAWDRSKNK